MLKDTPKTISGIFDGFGGPSAFAREIGINASTASEMKRRNSIPVRYWPALVTAAEAKGFKLRFAELVAIHNESSQL